MASSAFQIVLILAILGIYGCYCQDTCGSVQQFSQAGFVCAFPPNCCTRLLCTLSFLFAEVGQMDIRINPCTTPPTLDILVNLGGETIFNMSGISTSQSIPIEYGDILDTSIDLFFNSSMNSVTLAVLFVNSCFRYMWSEQMSAFDTEVIPPTTIDISNPGCEPGSVGLPPACIVTEAPPIASPSTQPPASGPTCQALQQLAGGANIGITTNNCAVNRECTTVSCNYLDLFPISLTLLPCNDPPAITFVAYNGTGGVVVFNETVTDSRRIPLEELGQGSAIIVNINRPCGQDAIIAEVVFSTIFNSTILPPTTIPIDRSNCTRVAATASPCAEQVTSFDDVCDAVESSIQSTASTCTTNYPDCTTTTCDLGQFNLPVIYGYTILPCTEVPSVNVYASINGTQILNETIANTRVETLNVGPTNVTARFIVNQFPSDYSSIQVGVNLISSDPPIEVPVFPMTTIPLNRCACPGVMCQTAAASSTSAPRVTAGSTQTRGGSASPSPSPGNTGSTTASQEPGAGNAGANRGTTSVPASSGSNTQVIIAAVIAAVLFVALLAAIAIFVALFIVLSKRYSKERESVSYKNLSAAEKSEELN